MVNLAKNSLMVFGFLFALVLLVMGLNELRGVLVGAEKTFEPKGVAALGITSNSATINFTTDKPAAALLSYGSNPSNLSLFAAEPNQTENHAITLPFLSPNTAYYYKIKIGENEYDNNGEPYTFTTKPAPTSSTPNYGTQFDNIDCSRFPQVVEQNNLEYDINRDGFVNTLDYTLANCAK